MRSRSFGRSRSKPGEKGGWHLFPEEDVFAFHAKKAIVGGGDAISGQLKLQARDRLLVMGTSDAIAALQQ